MSRFFVGSDLDFDVHSPTTFLFEIAASQTSQQSLVSEQFTINPSTPYAECQIGLEGNRLHRITAGVGHLSIQYRATIDRYHTFGTAYFVPETKSSIAHSIGVASGAGSSSTSASSGR